MNRERQLSPLDRVIRGLDEGLRTLCADPTPTARPTPEPEDESRALDASERRHAAGLMRINHAGEIAAQALYQAQALTARDPEVATRMQHSADEEIDHLAWCQIRLEELDSRTSRLAPLWYLGSFGVGTLAGIAGDRWSLGFVGETERQVCQHLEDHMERLPEGDERSRAILRRMHAEEQEHGDAAMDAGGSELPEAVRTLMWASSRVMTTLAYRI